MDKSLSLKRKEKDIQKLLLSKHKVILPEESSSSKSCSFIIYFNGPTDSPYEKGVWKILITLQEDYPFKSPSIGFINKIFHPNIDEKSGSVCLDVINQTWSPMYELCNIVEVFLPQLLLYPNPSDPLNSYAGELYSRNIEEFNEKVKEYVRKYAYLEGSNDNDNNKNGVMNDSISELSEASINNEENDEW